MKIVKIIIFGLAIIFGLLIVVGIFLPSTMKIEKSIVIDTPANVPYSQVTNLRNMQKWDPWSSKDTNMITTYEGPIIGTGSKRIWSSKNKNNGIGSMTIIKDIPFSLIVAELEFGDQGTSSASFQFEKIEKNRTKVTWSFISDIDIPIIGGYIVALMSSAVEKEYDKGLQNLKKLSENVSNKDNITFKKIVYENVSSQEMICISGATTQFDNNISQVFAKAFDQLVLNIDINKMKSIDKPMTISKKWEENVYEFDNCIPIAELKGELSAKVFKTKSYEGPTLRIEHLGSYSKMDKTYEAVMAYVSQLDLELAGSPWEVYINDSSHTLEEKLITHIYIPIK